MEIFTKLLVINIVTNKVFGFCLISTTSLSLRLDEDSSSLMSLGCNIALDIAEKRRNYIKGDMMYVEGRLKSRQYVDNQNITKSITEIVVDKMMILGTSRSQNASDQPNTSYDSYQQAAGNYQQATISNQRAAGSYQQPPLPSMPSMPDPGYDGDDLPF